MDDMLIAGRGALYKKDKAAYEARVAEFTKKYAVLEEVDES